MRQLNPIEIRNTILGVHGRGPYKPYHSTTAVSNWNCLNGQQYKYIEQNPTTGTEWAELAKSNRALIAMIYRHGERGARGVVLAYKKADGQIRLVHHNFEGTPFGAAQPPGDAFIAPSLDELEALEVS